ncbi:hypothetical protein OGM63_28245 [Plectonema radiosum NIES-515]|uniref:SD-repeat containing protein B domain-containing protein n=1 Tax=Plectonema radiosum NIES-515 TaxID=2986073 RepID=A0ABT3B7J4_9CYAN|nr:SdrD B-like domain-containing protein [Plectonema radiosum]MCV3217353.1 hypothetical protein [Plectonema radiosum NIES-515]
MKSLFKNLKAIAQPAGKSIPGMSVSLCTSLLTISASVGIGVTFNPERSLAGACAGVYSSRSGVPTTSQSQIGYYNSISKSYVNVATYNGGGNINAIASQPSTGNLFFVNRLTGKTVVYDVNTGSQTTLTGTLPAPTTTIIGATFDSSGKLYVYYSNRTLIEVNPATGSQTGSTIAISGIPGNNDSASRTTNGDIAIGTDGVLYAVGDTSSNAGSYTSQLYSIAVSGTTATATPVNGSNLITGVSGAAVNGLAIDPSTNKFYISTNNGTYELDFATKAGTLLTNAVGTNDLAACGSPKPDLPTINKAFSPDTVTGIPATSTLTLTLGNTNSVPIYLIQALTDNFQSGLTVSTPNGLSGTCTTIPGNTVTATAGSGLISLNDGFKIPAGGCTVSVNVTANSAATYTNNIPAGALKTFVGDNANAASSTLLVATITTSTVSGTLYQDTNPQDDTFNNGEPTLPANVTVTLYQDTNNNNVINTGEQIATTTTNASGQYTFTNVTNGNYKIKVDTSDTDIPAGYTLGTPNDTAITVSGANVSNINFGFDSPPPTPISSGYCESPYNEVYSGQTGNKIFAVHGLTGATIQLTGSAIASTVNSLAADHNNHLVYYAEGTSVYAWDAINNTHITITNNIRSFNSSLPTNSTLLSAGGAAFYNGSLYLGVDPPQAGVFEIYKVNFVPGSNGRTIQSVTPLNINGAGKANGQLNDGDWGDFIISDNGVILGSSGGTAKYWSFDLNSNTFTDLVDNIPQSSQLAKDGTGRLWAFRNGTSSVVEIQIVGNAIQTVGTPNSTSPHSSADAGECVTGLSSIGDRVFNDTDGDGVEDAGEGGFANVTVALYRDINGNGVIDATDPQLAIQTTDANGNYDFTGLIFGNYIVKVTDTNQVLTGKTITTGTNTKAVNLPTGIQDFNNADFGFNQPVASNPNVVLVKRITTINGSSFTDLIDGVKDANSPNYVPEPHDIDDNNTNWASNYLQGLLNGGTVRPKDEVEYTIYYLSAGDTTANNVLICDRVPDNATFIPTAFNSFPTKNTTGLPGGDRGIIWQNNGATESLTNTSDDDTAEYLSPGVDPTIKYPGIKCDGSNTNGVVVVKLGNLPNATAPGTPIGSYGFIRFRGKVK